MSDRDIYGWLEQWVDENIQTPQFVESKVEVANDARQCAADGIAAGYTIKELKEAAGGDIEAYLMDAQNSYTDSEVERRASRDD